MYLLLICNGCVFSLFAPPDLLNILHNEYKPNNITLSTNVHDFNSQY